MGRIFGILAIVLGLWVGAQVYLQGTERALGGALAFLGRGEEESAEPRTTPQRAGDAVQEAHRKAEDRLERALGE
jgi:hypothetical protein